MTMTSAEIFDLSAFRERRAAETTFSVLGPVRAWHGTAELELGAPQQRAVLAALLLREGAMATADELVRAVWGDEPPRTAVSTLRTYVSRLRAVLGGAIVSIAGGYALPVAADALDATRLARHLDRARRSPGGPEAVAELEAALALRQGQPLAGIPGPYAESQRARLGQLLTTAAIDRLTAEVERGRPGDAVPELVELLAEHPLREQLHELLMLALYRSGRQAEALEHYRATRELLAEELGVDPGPGLRRMHQGILAADRQLFGNRVMRLVDPSGGAERSGRTAPRRRRFQHCR